MSSYQKLVNIEKTDLLKIIESCNTLSGILIKLKINPKYQKCKDYLREFIINNNINFAFSREKSILDDIGLDKLKEAISVSICWMDVFRYLNIPFHGNRMASLRKIAIDNDLDYSHFDKRKALSVNNKQTAVDSEIFCEHSKVSRSTLKSRIIKKKLIEYKCADCPNIGIHNNKILILQLDHINGVRDDNRIDNLQFLCPNCHSQTSTYTGKNNIGR